MAYEILNIDSCIATTIEYDGGKGMITNISCVSVAEPSDIVTVNIEYKNERFTPESFALLFCASTEPHTECNVKQYVSEAFVLQPDESNINYQQFSMPENSVAYIAELQRWDIKANAWVSDSSKSGMIRTPEEEPADEDDMNKIYGLLAGIGLGAILLFKK